MVGVQQCNNAAKERSETEPHQVFQANLKILKLDKGDGIWELRKDVLGWIFDGMTKCME